MVMLVFPFLSGLAIISLSTALTTTSSLHSASGTTHPANATTTSANATATAAIANGTAVNTTMAPTSTSTAVFPTLSGVSSCVVGCLQVSVSQANCTSITDEACFCASATFRNATVSCVSTQCPAQLASAESLAQQFCSMVSVTVTFPPQTASGAATVSSTPITNAGAHGLGRLTAFAVLPGLIGLSCIVFGW